MLYYKDIMFVFEEILLKEEKAKIFSFFSTLLK